MPLYEDNSEGVILHHHERSPINVEAEDEGAQEESASNSHSPAEELIGQRRQKDKIDLQDKNPKKNNHHLLEEEQQQEVFSQTSRINDFIDENDE